MIWHLHYVVKGAHVHCRLFVAPREGVTFAGCGNITVSRGAEFADLMEKFDAIYLGESLAAATTDYESPLPHDNPR